MVSIAIPVSLESSLISLFSSWHVSLFYHLKLALSSPISRRPCSYIPVKTACIAWDALGYKYFKINIAKQFGNVLNRAQAPSLSVFLVLPSSTCQSLHQAGSPRWLLGVSRASQLLQHLHGERASPPTRTKENPKPYSGHFRTNHCDRRNAFPNWFRSQRSHCDMETESLSPQGGDGESLGKRLTA